MLARLIFLPEALGPRRVLEQILSIALAPEAVARLTVPVSIFRDPLREPAFRHAALPIKLSKLLRDSGVSSPNMTTIAPLASILKPLGFRPAATAARRARDRKSTRLNSSH